MKTPRWAILPILLLAGLLLYLATRGVSGPEMIHILRGIPAQQLIIASAIMTISAGLRAFRWQILLSSEKAVGYPAVFCASMVGALGNNYLPARSGELIRSACIGRTTSLDTSFVLATALGERVLDALLVSGIGCLAIVEQGQVPEILVKAAWLVALGAFAGVGIVLGLPMMEKTLDTLLLKLRFGSTHTALLQRFLWQFVQGARTFRSGSRVTAFICLTGCVWCVDALAAIWLARSMELPMAFSMALLLLAALGISSGLPSTPGFVGIFQFVAVAVLTPFGISRTKALAFIVAYQGLIYTVVTLWGLLSLWFMRSELWSRKGGNAAASGA
jgi:uncharacterized protein (TIRG00374 family)